MFYNRQLIRNQNLQYVFVLEIKRQTDVVDYRLMAITTKEFVEQSIF